MAKPDLSVEMRGMRLRNPSVLASGIWGTSGLLLLRAAKNGAGAVTSKSCSLKPREGHPNPTIVMQDAYVLNAVGLSNPGAREEVEELKVAKKECAKLGAPVIASIFAHSISDFREAAQIICEARPDAVEVNISCPNVANEGRMFACSSVDAAAATSAVKEALDGARIPVFVKLSPNAADVCAIAKAVEGAGADGIVAINTMPGMLIDAKARRPVLSNKTGGVSGRALKPIALKIVYDLARKTGLPIIGTGGVMNGEDMAEMLMAGASAVGIGSAVSYRKDGIGGIVKELGEFMQENGYSKVSELKLEE